MAFVWTLSAKGSAAGLRGVTQGNPGGLFPTTLPGYVR